LNHLTLPSAMQTHPLTPLGGKTKRRDITASMRCATSQTYEPMWLA
jgi:hypothetical protein